MRGNVLRHVKREGGIVQRCRGGAADFKVGVQNRIRERSELIFFTPSLFRMWGYKQANISRGLLNILKFAVWRLVVALINIGRLRPMVL